MSYTPTTWANGDTITAAGLNKIEQGIAATGGVVVLHMDENTYALDKTWNEIHTLLGAGTIMFLVGPYSGYPGGLVGDIVKYVYEDEGNYAVVGYDFFAAATAANDYPIVD